MTVRISMELFMQVRFVMVAILVPSNLIILPQFMNLMNWVMLNPSKKGSSSICFPKKPQKNSWKIMVTVRKYARQAFYYRCTLSLFCMFLSDYFCPGLKCEKQLSRWFLRSCIQTGHVFLCADTAVCPHWKFFCHLPRPDRVFIWQRSNYFHKWQF